MSSNEQPLQDMLKDILQQVRELPAIQAGEIPGIDLYMDQVTTFMEERLASYRRNEGDKILTKTMINNYAKNHLLPPPEKKKYSREHMLVLIFIYYFKSVLSLQDIQSVLDPITEKYFGSTSGLTLEEIYSTIFSFSDEWLEKISEDVETYAQVAVDALPSASEEDQEFTAYFSLICALCFDMYVKKRVVEKLIDTHAAQSTQKSASEKPSRDKSARKQKGTA